MCNTSAHASMVSLCHTQQLGWFNYSDLFKACLGKKEGGPGRRGTGNLWCKSESVVEVPGKSRLSPYIQPRLIRLF